MRNIMTTGIIYQTLPQNYSAIAWQVDFDFASHIFNAAVEAGGKVVV